MPDLATSYGIPPELQKYIDTGFLVVVFEKPEEKTVTFGIPSLAFTDEDGEETYFTLDWIHPDFNAQFCHYYHETPGDLANFYLTKACRGRGDELVEVEDLEELVAWLDERHSRR